MMNCFCNLDEKKNELMVDYNTYTGNYERSPEVDSLKRTYLDTALRVVEEYLGYSLFQQEYIEEHVGVTGKVCYLNCIPACEVYSLRINGEEIDSRRFILEGDHIRIVSPQKCDIFHSWDSILVDYSAGYREIPAIIKMTIFRIASLLLSEAGGNIAVTSKSFSDNTRSFVNYTNWDKFLQPLAPMRRNLLK